MLSGIYACASTLQTLEQQQDIIAHNLANAETAGFKRSKGVFRSFKEVLAGEDTGEAPADLAGTAPVLATEIDLTKGSLRQTGGSLDLAIEGDGFFVLRTPAGQRYTRRGSFQLSEDGTIVNSLGWALTSDSGDLIVPRGVREIAIQSDGQVMVDDAPMGKVMVVDVPDKSQLVRTEQCTFRTVDEDTFLPLSVESKVRQGYIETSNVQVIDEMVAMIATLRIYEASQRMLSQQAETLDRLTRAASQ